MSAPNRHSPVYFRVHNTRVVAHKKHADSSLEDVPWSSVAFRDAIGEEVGEICRAFNEYRHGNISRAEAMRQVEQEALQLAGLACALVDRVMIARGHGLESES